MRIIDIILSPFRFGTVQEINTQERSSQIPNVTNAIFIKSVKDSQEWEEEIHSRQLKNKDLNDRFNERIRRIDNGESLISPQENIDLTAKYTKEIQELEEQIKLEKDLEIIELLKSKIDTHQFAIQALNRLKI